MGNKYYYVPVTSRMINHKDVSLLDMLSIVDEELFERENDRVLLTYETDTDKEKVEQFNETTRSIFEQKGLPQRLVLVRNDGKVTELVTGVIFSSPVDTYLDAFEIDGLGVVDVFADEGNYPQKAESFINSYFLNKRNVLSKTDKKSIG